MTLESIGKYKILGEIGEGAMGIVYKAHDPFLNRYVAIKMISASLKADNELRERFQREAQAAASLNHPNIVTVHDFGEEQGKIFMAMELLEGTDLREVIGNPAQRRLEDKLAIMEQVCDGLAFAHAKTIVHRDLKPGNIHILPNGQVKIMDFGLARLGSSDMTATGLVMGTPNYMSPEQVMGERVDVRSDVFSLGAVFYELLTSRKPFEADSVHGVLYKVVHKEPAPVRQYAPSVPQILVKTVEKALKKDRNQRFQDAGEMRDALALVRQAMAEGRAEEATLSEMLELEAVDVDATMAEADGPAQWTEGTGALEVEADPGTAQTQADAGAAARGAAATRPRTPRIPRPTPMPRRAASEAGIHSRLPLYFGGAAALAAVTALAVISLRRQPETHDMSNEVSVLTRGLVRTQMTLASRYLDDKDYPKAITQAQETLQVDPRNPEVKRLLEDAQKKQVELDSAAAEARTAFEAGDSEKASAALARVNELNPNHPIAKELLPKLNRFFRSQAEEGRRAMERSREQAQRSNAGNLDTFAAATGLSREAEARFSRQEFGEAYRGFLESRDAFDRARRTAEAARVEVTTTQRTQAPPPPVTAPPGTVAPVATQPPATLPPVTQPPVTAPPAPGGRPFHAAATTAIGPIKKGEKVPKGFEPPHEPPHPAALQFEVTPPEVKPGDNYTLKVFLQNNGDAPIKIKAVTANARVNGGRATPVSGNQQSKQVAPHEKGLVLEVPGQWPDGVNTWRLDVVISSERGDEYKSQLTLS